MRRRPAGRVAAAAGDIDGLTLFYRTAGPIDGRPVVLLHGLGSNGAAWEPVVASPMSTGRRMYMPDFRGHGRSDRPGTYSFEILRDDLRGFISALGLGRVGLIGHSAGGVAAYLLAQAEPDLVEYLVLEETPPPVPHQRPIPERPRGPLPYDWDARTAIIGQVNAPDPTWWERLPEITTPTLVISGGPESPFSPEAIRAMAQRLPNGRFAQLDVGHRVHATAPTEFTAIVTEFITTVSAIEAPGVTIARLSTDDWTSLWPMIRIEEDTPESARERFETLCRDPSWGIFGAMDHSGRMLGYAAAQDYGPHLRLGDIHRTARFHDLYVLPDDRRRGAGRALVAAVAGWASTRARYLEWQAHTERAAPFYERLGYRGEACPQPDYPTFVIDFRRSTPLDPPGGTATAR